jgi:hypothetical protein
LSCTAYFGCFGRYEVEFTTAYMEKYSEIEALSITVHTKYNNKKTDFTFEFNQIFLQ